MSRKMLDRNVSETADLVGFNTPSHFTTVFREFYQQTPSEFMANHARNARNRAFFDVYPQKCP